MKPNFALTLSFETIGLLHRTSRGWMPIGEVPTDSPDLAEALSYLRSSALGLSTQGMTCKVVLPASEILYTAVDCTDDDPEKQLAAVRAALDGMTPYAVDELVFDITGEPPRLQVAVIARETLEQAEAFAVEHRFNPVSLVALPPEGRFDGEPFFGETAAADGLLTGESAVERDDVAIVVVTQGQPRDGEGRPARKANRAERRAKAAAVQAAEPAEPADAQATLTLADVTAVAPAAASVPDPAHEMAEPPAPVSDAPADDAAPVDAAPDQGQPPAMPEPEVPQADAGADAASEAPLAAEPPPPATEPSPAQPGPDSSVELTDERPGAPAAADPAPAVPEAGVDEATGTAEPPADTPAPAKDASPPAVSSPAAETPAPAAAETSDVEAPFIEVASEPEPEPEPAATVRAVPEAPKLGALPTFSSRRRDAAGPEAPGAPVTPPQDIPPPKPAPAPEAHSDPAAPPPTAEGPASPPTPPLQRPNGFDAPVPLKTRPVPDAGAPVGRGPAVGPAGGGSAVAANPATIPLRPAVKPPVGLTGEAPAAAASVAAFSKIPPGLRSQGAPGPRGGDEAARKPPRNKVLPSTASAAATALPPGRASGSRAQVLDQSAMAGRPPNASPLRTVVKPVGGKPRYLGLVLTGILLLFLAVVAAWSSMVLSRLDDDDAAEVLTADLIEGEGETLPLAAPAPVEVSAGERATAPAPTPPVAVADLPAEADETADLPAAEPDTVVAAADLPATPEPEPAPEPEPEAAPPPAAASQQGEQGRPLPRPDSAAGSEIQLSALDAPPPAFDALALPAPAAAPDRAPVAAMAPPPEGTTYSFDDQGRIAATERGVVTPDGVWLIAARPPRIPPPRPASVEAAAAPAANAPAADAPTVDAPTVDAPAAEAMAGAAAGAAAPVDPVAASAFAPDIQVNGRRPRARPEGLVPPPADPPAQQAEDDAALPGPVDSRLASLRPRARPASIVAAAAETARASDAASLVLAASQAPAARSAFAGASPLAVPISRRPATRPQDFSKAVAAAVAAATAATPAPAATARAVDPEEEDEPEPVATAAPRIPTRADVARQATFANAINLSRLNLIGIYGTSSKRYAMVRTPNGRYTKVNVGDRLDGGQVVAITASELRYQKGGRVVALAMPKG